MTFSELCIYLSKLENTPSRNAMTEILAELFHKSPEDEIGKICYLLQGRVAPLYEAIEFGIADKLIIRAISKATNTSDSEVLKEFKKTGDIGITAQNIKTNNSQRATDKNITIISVFNKLSELAHSGGSGSVETKINILASLIRDLDALSVRFVVRIPIDKLRLGFSDMTILDSLSWMLKGDKSLRIKLEDAYNVRPDIGYISQTIKTDGVQGLSHVRAKVGAPILASLCGRLPTADEMIKKMGEVNVEPKYDGVRTQIHYQKSKIKNQKSKVNTYSRNLENTTSMFPELKHIDEQIQAHEVILDSEAIGYDPKTGKFISFQETITRKRKHDIQNAKMGVPLKFFVFDILYRDGEDLLQKPLSERRAILEKTIKKGEHLIISPHIVTSSPNELRGYHDSQLKLGLEGAVVKKWHSPYEPGRRGFSWVKFKEEEGKTGKLTDTIDAVVMGYYRGKGKRVGFGIGAFLVGVKRGDSFVTLTKIGTGVSDDLWKELEVKLHKLEAKVMPKEYKDVNKTYIPDVWVDPKLVVELAGDDLTKSPSHGAGIAVRFPRLVRIRTDKSVSGITTTREIEQMFHNQKTAKM